jgi:paired amphipathic helix protein Sin3a
LEILQTYQRESKPIQDVYAQVTRLFESAPDLLEDFKQFLPESAAQAKAAANRSGGEDAFTLSNTRHEPGYAAAMTSMVHHTPRADQPRLPPMGNFAPTPSSKDNKRKRGERQGQPATIPTGIPLEQNNIGQRATLNQGQHLSKVSRLISLSNPHDIVVCCYNALAQ